MATILITGFGVFAILAFVFSEIANDHKYKRYNDYLCSIEVELLRIEKILQNQYSTCCPPHTMQPVDLDFWATVGPKPKIPKQTEDK